jgi:hypothetical protein
VKKKFDIFAYLIKEGFSKGIDLHFEQAFHSLSNEEMKQIDDLISNSYECFGSEHISVLIRKTRIASDSPGRSESFEESLEVSEVLTVVALCENLRITVDFEEKHVARMNPLKSKEVQEFVSSLNQYTLELVSGILIEMCWEQWLTSSPTVLSPKCLQMKVLLCSRKLSRVSTAKRAYCEASALACKLTTKSK